MNIKSLLLGSAAAFAVVSGAQAADAVVAAEPEPMEYVKVCDAYGTGFFYIPGTETCLKVGGQLRYEKLINKTGGADTIYWQHSRIKLDVEAKNDSEWGTVYSWIRIQGDEVNNGDPNNIDGSSDATGTDGIKFYYIFGIGGLEMSNFDSQWAKFFGYGGFTDDGGVYSDDWDKPDSRQYISYTVEFGSVKAYIAAQNDADEYYAAKDGTLPSQSYGTHGGHKYMPDLDGGAVATIGDWQVAGGVAYDESEKAVALKGLIAGNFGMFGVRFMPLWSNKDTNTYMPYDGFSAILGLQAKVTDSITLSKDLQIWDNGDWRIVGDVNWQVATGFSVLVEGIYADRFDTKTKQGMLRFQRDF